MDISVGNVGIIGGTGMLGRAISCALLEKGAVAPQNFWMSNRSGNAGEFSRFAGLNVTADNQVLVQACETVILCVPPAAFKMLSVDLQGKLVISVMAGITISDMAEATAATRIIRAISSPAAEHGLAFSPWVANAEVTEADRIIATKLLGVCGITDELRDEAHIDCFTALTGPVPGFVALFADAMARYAVEQGVEEGIADRAIRQLFLSAGTMMAEDKKTPAEHVREMVGYAGTTAAGLLAMKELKIPELIAKGLDAAVAKTRNIGD